MTIDIDAAWKREQDDVINVVADIECPSAQIQYAFQAGCLAGRDIIARVVDERERLRVALAATKESSDRLLAERDQYMDRLGLRLPTDEAAISAIMDDVVNLEYMNCSDDPDLCHVTRDELSLILRRRLLGVE